MEDLIFCGIKINVPILFPLFQFVGSSCRMFASELIQRYMAVSSAKSLTLDLTCSGRLFMYAKKRMGPRTEPCGTPVETGMRQMRINMQISICLDLTNANHRKESGCEDLKC